MWTSMREVPQHWKRVDRAHLTSVDQANQIYFKLIERWRQRNGRLHPMAYHHARQQFASTHQKRKVGNHWFWVDKEEGQSSVSAFEEGGGD